MGWTPGRVTAAIGLLVAAVLALVLTALVATGSPALQDWDQAVTDAIRGWADPLGWPVTISKWIGWLTEPLTSACLAGLLAVVLYRKSLQPAALLVVACAVTGVLVSEVVKQFVGRTRPPAAALYRDDLTKSFPSGHAMAGIYLYCLAGFVLLQIGRAQGGVALRVSGVALMIFGPVIGLTRLGLGVHWPSDVLGGWAYGFVVVLAWGVVMWSELDGSWSGPDGEAEPDADSLSDSLPPGAVA